MAVMTSMPPRPILPEGQYVKKFPSDDLDFKEYKRYVCKHYRRGCKIYAPCCKKYYSCRICHDEKESHKLDRTKVSKLKCLNCDMENEITDKCVHCQFSFGAYVCLHCRLFDDDDSKKQFHCDKCGICRVGGRENFFHCDVCGYCMNNSLKDSHKCIPNASSNGCPVCLEDLHSSREGVSVPKCGHLIHSNCLKSMADQGLYRCPTCNASILNMDRHWKHLDQEVKAWPMPRRYKHFLVEVLCNDCHEVSKVKYHIIGMKCGKCPSFNTRRTGQETPPDETDSEFSSESDLELSDDESATPFERHISQLLRTLSARVRALENEGELDDTVGDNMDIVPSLVDDDTEESDPSHHIYPYMYEPYGEYTEDEDDYDEDDTDSDTSGSWETEQEEEIHTGDQNFVRTDSIEGGSKDSGFSESGDLADAGDQRNLSQWVDTGDQHDLSHWVDTRSQQDLSQGCSIM